MIENFRDSIEFKDIKYELEYSGVYDKIANFKCYADNVFTYSIEHDGFLHEFNFICDDFLFPVCHVKHILSLKGIKFINHSIYYVCTNDEGTKYTKEGQMTWKVDLDEAALN